MHVFEGFVIAVVYFAFGYQVGFMRGETAADKFWMKSAEKWRLMYEAKKSA